MIQGIDHLGIAIKNLDEAVARWTAIMGHGPEHTETVEDQGVRTAFFSAGPSRVELLEAIAADSPVARFLERRGEGLHHVCFVVEDVARTLAELEAAGVRLVDREPRPGADGKLVAFVHPSSASGVLIELSQDAPGAGG